MPDRTEHEVEKTIAGKTIKLQSGYLAKQAGGAVLLTCGGTQILAIATMSRRDTEKDFFPLTVEYVEKFYGAGKIPGGYLRREGKPSDHEVLVCRMIDRPLRPLFPSILKREVQIVITVLSMDKNTPPDALGGFAASAALAISDVPFAKPIGSVRVIMNKQGEVEINPGSEEIPSSSLELIVAGTAEAVTMIEGDAAEVSEEVLLKAVEKAKETIDEMLELTSQLKEKCGKEKLVLTEPLVDEELKAEVRQTYMGKLGDVMKIVDKLEREAATAALYSQAQEELAEKHGAERAGVVSAMVHDLESELVRSMILKEKKRNDGRAMDELREIDIRVRQLANVHGSAVFTRGETQALVAVSLGSDKDAQRLDLASGQDSKSFFLHYNFPPYSVGEVGRFGGAGRREIGHGMLAEKSILAILEDKEDFPFTVRVVSEILESNGSSSMATICGTSLALMDAGVPLPTHVAGVAMGLVKGEEGVQILTDIAGLEDHLGDMDFKVAGTKKGITGFQLDIKVDGITMEIMKEALQQAKKARLEILDKMFDAIPKSGKLSPSAPRVEIMEIKVDRIKALIGVGGKNIKGIIEQTGSDISVDDDGKVSIFAKDGETLEKTKELVELTVGMPRVDSVHEGKVKKITSFGMFVEIAPGLDGLCHISKFANERIENIADHIREGEMVKVKVESIDDMGRVSLSRKALL